MHSGIQIPEHFSHLSFYSSNYLLPSITLLDTTHPYVDFHTYLALPVFLKQKNMLRVYSEPPHVKDQLLDIDLVHESQNLFGRTDVQGSNSVRCTRNDIGVIHTTGLSGCCLSCETSSGQRPTQYVNTPAKESRNPFCEHCPLQNVSLPSSPG